MWQTLLQSASGITECDSYYKVTPLALYIGTTTNLLRIFYSALIVLSLSFNEFLLSPDAVSLFQRL